MAINLENRLAPKDPPANLPNIPPALDPQDPQVVPGRRHRRRFATARVVLALMLREMTTRYGRSPGGYVWAILEPIGMIAVMAFGFALVLRAPSLGNSFLLFYAAGFLPFSAYQDIEAVTRGSISFSRQLLLYPAVTWLDAILARFFLNLLTKVLVTAMVLAAILYFTETTTVIDLPVLVLAMGLAALTGLGFGTFGCLVTGLSPLWNSIWKVAARPMFLASAVIYIYEDLPTLAQNVLWWNPLVHITGLMRAGVYPGYEPQYLSLPFVVGAALLVLVLFAPKGILGTLRERAVKWLP